MGQGHSSGAAQPPTEVAYHPSAVGYTKDARKHAYVPSSPPSNEPSMRRSRIGPMRNRAKGKQPATQPDPGHPSPRTPEWSTTLTAFPPVPTFDAVSRGRSATLPSKLEHSVAVRPQHARTIFQDDGEAKAPHSATGTGVDAATPLEETSPASLTPPSQLHSSSPSPSPRGEYRVSAQPTHPSIIEVPELETVDSALAAGRRRKSEETIRSPSRASDEAQRDTLRVPGAVSATHIGAAEARRVRDTKRASNGTDTSQEAPSLAPTTSSGLARRADESNDETVLAYWRTANRASDQEQDLTSLNRQRYRHSWSSGRSASDGRNASPYRSVSGRWTSHWEDHRGLGISQSASSFGTAEDIAMADDSANGNAQREQDRSTAPMQDASNAVPAEQSPERFKRKPVPEHEFGPASSSSPPRALARLSKRFSDPLSSDDATSKRASDQSHFSAVTGALHQHVERLRAGPTYQIDENASRLFEPPQQPATPLPDPTSQHRVSPAPVSPSSYRRGRALSLSLMNKLKNRTHKTSDALPLSAAVPASSGDRMEALTTSRSDQSAPASATASSVQVSFTPRRASELTLQAVHAASQVKPTSRAVRAEAPAPHSLYQSARRPSRTAVPTTATSETGVVSRLVSAPASSTSQLRGINSAATARLSPRPASLASRRSSRSKRSSNASLRAAAAAAAATSKSTRQASAATASASVPWWNPWLRKASLSALPFANKSQHLTTSAQATSVEDEEAGWVDVPEDDRGLVSPVAEDPRSLFERQVQGPEKVQQPWAPVWSKRVLQAPRESAAATTATAKDAAEPPLAADVSRRNSAADALQSCASSTEHRGSVSGGAAASKANFDGTGALHPTYNGAPPPIASSSSSSFTSLAPPPAPAPVPPPRKQRRRSSRTDVLAGYTPSSSSPTSPTMPTHEDSFQTVEGAAAGERRPSVGMLRGDSTGATSDTSMAVSPTVAQAGVPTTKSRTPSLTNTEARESLLSDDLDYAPSGGVAEDDSGDVTADDLDCDATMHLYRSSLVNARRPRGGAQVNLSPVREIMTPESRPRTGEDRSGALSAASTIDAHHTLYHRRINSGASMALVAGSPVAGDSAMPERRPVPAKSVVAEPHTDMASVHGASSPVGSSSLAPSTVGGPTSVSSMKKHTGPLPEALLAATAALGNRHSTMFAGDARLRSLSSPVEPNAFHRLSMAPAPVQRLSLAPLHADEKGGQRDSRIRESWRSTDGPWSARIMSDIKTMPAARGMTRASVRPIARHQRSGSAPLAAADASNELEANAGDLNEASMIVHAPAPDEDDSNAVPFAETAVQASLAALQALEKSEEAHVGGDWRARWASEKLLGFSSSHLAPPSMMGRLPDDDYMTGEDQSDYSGARSRRRAEPYPRSGRLVERSASSSVDLQASRRLARARRQEATSSSASQLYDSSMAGGGGDGLTTDSEQGSRRRRHRRHRQKESSMRYATKPPTAAAAAAAAPPRVSVTTAEWDETIVPAHAKRLELEAREESRWSKDHHGDEPSLLASGMVAPASPSIRSDSVQEQDRAAVLEPPQLRTRALEEQQATSQHRKQRSSKLSGKRREADGGESGSKFHTSSRRHRAAQHGQYPSTSAVSLAKSTRSASSSSSTRKGYGCDDIVAWQASLHFAALPPVAES